MSVDNYIVPGLSNGIKLLTLIAESKTPLTLTDLVKHSGFAKTSVFRTIHTLQSFDLVIKDDKTNTYSLGLGVLKLGFWKLSQMDIGELGQEVLEELRNQTGYSAHIVIKNGTEAIYIARAASKNRVVASGIGPGTHLPICRTGVGRMLISDLSYEDFLALYPLEIIETTNYPDTKRSDLWTLIQKDRENGYVVSESFFEKGICSVVYPIRQNKKIVAVITLTIPAETIDLGEKTRLQEQVKQAAEKVSSRLQFHK